MNILPKKSWHVRTKKNIERVRRDEEKAAEEEKERQKKIALAEQEARTQQLRERSKKRGHQEIEATPSSSLALTVTSEPSSSKVAKPSSDISLDQGGHINFFKDIEEGLRREGKNKEYEAEKAAEKEKWEKNIGLLTYLGQSSIESQNDKPWYLHKSKPESEFKQSVSYDVKQAERCDKDEMLKGSLDPLKDMKRHLEKQHKHKDSHKHKHKEHKHHRSSTADKAKASSSSTKSSSSSSTSQSDKSKTIEQLRAERLKREALEKQKISAVMARARGEVTVEKEDKFVSDVDRDRARGYNSRYNPNFVKPTSYNRR